LSLIILDTAALNPIYIQHTDVIILSAIMDYVTRPPLTSAPLYRYYM